MRQHLIPPEPEHRPSAATRRFLARATLLSAALSMAGAVLGLGRDQVLAHLFGAGAQSDAFLVAWTVPEMASTLLIEDGMAFVLVPAFSLALARRAAHGPGAPDPVRALVAASLPRLCLALAGTAALLAAGAPQLVSLLAPGLSDPSLAVSCTRLTATCVLSFGLAGYSSAALRAHRSYLAPGAIYIAYNIAIITTMFALGARWGVRAAALGVALGGCLMAAVQAPSLWRRIARRPEGAAPAPASPYEGDGGRTVALGLVCAVLLFALCRQSQVLIERFLAAGLPAGAISHLNYAQKVAQLPMSLSMMVCVVTFPVVARAIAEGDTRRAGERVERDLALMACLVLLGTAVVVAGAPQIVQLLFQRGAFTAQDTAATAAVMRVYALGLLGQTLVGALVRSYFSTGRTTWFPLAAMGAGALATAGIGLWAVDPWGARGIAAANAAGITLTALLLLLGLGPRTVPVRVRLVVAELSRPVRAAVCATVAGLWCARQFDSPAACVAACCLAVTAVFVLLAWVLDAAGARSLLLPVAHSVRSSVTRKLRHGR
ncbi:murein biosynthesis protein MurJ [Streptomyces sp. uw30]|uniref:murein biosynthesis integral membrane protein MurJ n=1 Tax=Streptomyces sp. uw30 TaxID=1828179 RepID=UPI0011CE411D|nr:lipid II flippase MurJ [Streptomyces sp. uw30]TXS40442.1 murein biosynthesis protein MurJ [Streptomyces sp. uw30]